MSNHLEYTYSSICASCTTATLSELRLLLDYGAQDPGVGDDHDEQREEVDGDQEEEGEGDDGPGVGAEGDALLGGGGVAVAAVLCRRGSRARVPDEDLRQRAERRGGPGGRQHEVAAPGELGVGPQWVDDGDVSSM